MKRILWTLALWASLAWACGEPAPSGGQVGGECATHADCAQDEVCAGGQCQNLLCETDQECPFGYECSQGVCAAVEGFCNRNGDCRSGELCDRDTQRCVPAGQVERPCTTARDCLAGEACEEGLCAPAEAPNNSGAECEQDRDCPLDQRCERGACVPSDEAPDASEDPAQDPTEDTSEDTAQDPTDDAAQDLSDEPDLPDPTLCVADLDCPPDQACDGGFCATWACTRDAECPYSYQCSLERCQRVPDFCTTDLECLPERLCDPARQRCAAVEQLPGRCLTPAQCLPDELCTEDGYCEPPLPDPDPDLAEDVADPEPDLPDLDAPDDVIEDTPDDVIEDAPDDVIEDTPDDVIEDTPDDVAQDIAPDVPDMMEDTAPDVVEDLAPDVIEDIMPDIADDPAPDVEEPFVPPPTPPRGVYEWTRPELANLGAFSAVELHPRGGYALVLGYSNGVWVFPWDDLSSPTALTVPRVGNRTIYWRNVAFDPRGRYALLGGNELDNGVYKAVVYRFDAQAWATAPDQATALTRLYADPSHSLGDLDFGWEGENPVLLLSYPVQSFRYPRLRQLNPDTGMVEGLDTLSPGSLGPSGGECVGFGRTSNEFGGPGFWVNCGGYPGGADAFFYTEIGGVGEWRKGQTINATNLGNPVGGASHRPGDYTLFYNYSGTIMRAEGGRVISQRQSFQTYSFARIQFQQEGQRALLVGGNLKALEYRHDQFFCARGTDCLTDASITGTNPVTVLPTNATLTDAAFHPGCDGGLVVGSNTNSSAGYLFRFRIVGGRACP